MNNIFSDKNIIDSFDFETGSPQTIEQFISSKLNSLADPGEYESIAYRIILYGCEMISSIPIDKTAPVLSDQQINDLKKRIHEPKKQAADQSPSHYPAAVSLMLKHIHNNYNTTINNSELAEISGLSPNYAGKLFHEHVGISVSNFLHLCRIKKACHMLSNTNLKIYEIALQVGYSESYYFSHIFKKVMKISPIEYRKGPSKRPEFLNR